MPVANRISGILVTRSLKTRLVSHVKWGDVAAIFSAN